MASTIANMFVGIGFDFAESTSDVVIIDELVSHKQSLPEVLNSENTIKVLQNDDIYFERDSRPTFFDLYIEKSPYQNISEEMLKFMSTVVDFNNLIGEPVNRYRDRYKGLEKLRQSFFKRVKNIKDVEKFIDYYKWFDDAVSAMILNLVPATSDFAGVQNVATLPSLDEARAKIVGILRSPAQKIASILLAPASKIAILALEKSKK